MGKEIERKYLVRDASYKQQLKGVLHRQGYLSSDMNRIVRIRAAGEKGFITIKGKTVGITRAEYEYEIPLKDANEMLDNLCKGHIVEKIRYKLEHEGNLWTIDEFFGKNKGLELAEIELENEDDLFSKPQWLGAEVTHDPRYFNSNLSKNPYKNWLKQAVDNG